MSQSLDQRFLTTAELSRERSIKDGYDRGLGLEFGGVADLVGGHPLFRSAIEAVGTRSIMDWRRRQNIFLLLKYYIPRLEVGDIIEFGTYKGGNVIFMATICKALGLPTKVYGLDTFEGMPETDHTVDAHRAGDFKDIDFQELKNYTDSLGLDNVEWVKGTFEETTRSVLERCRALSMIHIDCDIKSAVRYAYQITKPKMIKGGYVVFDDATTSSCIGATEVVEDDVIRADGLNSEQIYPHFVFRAP